jgi:hypothetical protein
MAGGREKMQDANAVASYRVTEGEKAAERIVFADRFVLESRRIVDLPNATRAGLVAPHLE